MRPPNATNYALTTNISHFPGYSPWTWNYFVGYYVLLLSKLYMYLCQKKAIIIRCIFKSSYNSHTDPLFQKGGILQFDDRCTLEIGRFVFDGLHNMLPNRISQLMQSNMTIHDHVARQHHNPHVHLRSFESYSILLAKKITSTSSPSCLVSDLSEHEGI